MARMLAIVILTAGIAAAAAFSRPQQAPQPGGAPQPPAPAAQPPTGQPPASPGAKPGDMRDIGRKLVEGLKATPGCLGTEIGAMQSGKSVIFAWFENKKAAVAWYESETHKAVMERFFPGQHPDHPPLEFVADDAGPIMAVAALKPNPRATEGSLPVSQIAIELYAPLPGGIRVNGGFAPDAVKPAHMRIVDLKGPPPPAPEGPVKPGEK